MHKISFTIFHFSNKQKNRNRKTRNTKNIKIISNPKCLILQEKRKKEVSREEIFLAFYGESLLSNSDLLSLWGL